MGRAPAMKKPKPKPKDVDSYIARSDPEARPKLEELRTLIRSTLPKAEERIWYGVPFYKYHGELAGFAAYRNHVSFGFGAGVLHHDDREMLERKGYITGKGTLQIRFDQRMPTPAIRKILGAKARMNEAKRGAKRAPNGADASEKITRRIRELGDWRGEALARIRRLIRDADPGIQEEWKWRGTPVWSQDGGVCTGESYKQVVKLTFFRGASLRDPKKLFNSSLEGNTRRAIDLREGGKLNEAAFKELIRAAVAANSAARARRR